MIRAQLQRNRVDLLSGAARFVDEHAVEVVGDRRGEHQTVTAAKIVVATGTRPARPPQVEFDDRRVVDSDGILAMEQIPASMVVVGAGVIGIEYASMFAALGTRVTVVERRPQMLDFCDAEVIESLKFHLRDLAVTFRFGEEVSGVSVSERGTVTTLASGKKIPAETVMYSAGRQGVTDELSRGARRARGGRPRPAQGRRALPHRGAAHLRRRRRHRLPRARRDVDGAGPAGRVPRVRRAGAVDDRGHAVRDLHDPGGQLLRRRPRPSSPSRPSPTRSASRATASSRAARSSATTTACSSCWSPPTTHALLGVHVFGTSATELIHIGQAIMGCGGTVDYLVDAVLNFPTLSEAYKVAALDATNKIRALEQFA